MRIEQRAVRQQERVQRRQDAQQLRQQQPESRAERREQRQQQRQIQVQERRDMRQLQTQDRRQIRQLQAEQRRELRNRNLSRTERRNLITEQRQQMRNLRVEQRQQREQRRQALQTPRQNALDQNQNAREQRRADRRNIEAARQGRFAARYHNRGDRREARLERAAARHAWRKGKRAAFVAWLGPVFYPYAYSDIFEYTYWPYAYADAYWAYVYDDFFDGVFWGYGNPYVDGGYVTASIPSTTGSAPPSQRRAFPRGTPSTAQLCGDPGKGITAWPFTQIEQAVKPDDEQKRLLDELKRAAADAAAAFKASCEDDIALTPTGRLAAMTRRVEATLRAVRTVRPALDAFYNSLTDEQKARFTNMGPEEIGADERKRAQREPSQAAQACDAKAGLVDLPMQEIEQAVQPTQAQREKFDRLSLAATSAVELLQAACPDTIALTPSGRLEQMEKRLDALVQAANTVQPALADFYASLTNEQKAQFNVLGRQAQRAN
jgi:hypothetical protein